MSIWELTGFSTEQHGERAVRYRRYTSSPRTAELFAQIPRINFSDSGHGIVFGSSCHSGKRKPLKLGCVDHVVREMDRLRRETRSAEVRRAGRDAADADFADRVLS